MFKPNNLRKWFMGLLALGAMRSIESLVLFYMECRMGHFASVAPMFLKNLLLSFSPAALAYILYWFAKRKQGEEPEEEQKPEEEKKPEDENLISDEALGKIVKGTTWVLYILAMVGVLIFFELNRK